MKHRRRTLAPALAALALPAALHAQEAAPATSTTSAPPSPVTAAAGPSPLASAARHSPASASAGDPPVPAAGLGFRVAGFEGRLSAYLQAQYERHEQSEDQLAADGRALLNQDRFLLRRGRIMLTAARPYVEMVFELDANTANGPQFAIPQAEATLRYPAAGAVPAVALSAGVFRTPFGFETQESARDRVFSEPSTAQQAFFPGQSDLGVRLRGGASWFRYALALVNGHPIDEPVYGSRAPTASGDVVLRLGVDTGGGTYCFRAGVSALAGTGFHPGTAATKDSLTVRDLTESGALTPQSLQLVPGRAAVPSQSFAHWAAGLDVSLAMRFNALARLWLYGELYVGQNIDRGLYVADPIATGVDVRQLGFVLGATQLLGNALLLGLRAEYYDPAIDATGRQGGRVVLQPRSLVMGSFLAGFQVPDTQTRVILQYDSILDHLALGRDGSTTDLANNRLTARVQVAF
jgi:hypothetical protein